MFAGKQNRFARSSILAIFLLAGCQSVTHSGVVVEKHHEAGQWIFLPHEQPCGKGCTTTEVLPMYYPESYEVEVVDSSRLRQKHIYWVTRNQFASARVGGEFECEREAGCSESRPQPVPAPREGN